MNISIQSLSFHASDRLINFAERRITKLRQNNDRITEAHMTLRIDRSGTKQNKVCKMKLEIPGTDLCATMQCESFEEAILKTGEALRKQLSSSKVLDTKHPLTENKK